MTDLLPQLQEFHHEKLAALLRHQAGARRIVQYDANNTYQYIINREEAQLSWIAKAIVELGGAPPLNTSDTERSFSGKGKDAVRAILEEDGRTDLLGTRSPAAGVLVGEVLPERWIE